MEQHERESVRDLLEAALEKLSSADRASELSSAPAENTFASRPSSSRPGTDAPHPGHERFTIIEARSPLAGQKTCYMEPSRPCVNSGACEMRGF